MGKILEINLSNETSKLITISKDIYKKFIGGKGLGAYLMFEKSIPGISGLDERNPLIFLTGPLTGTGFPTSGRMVVVSKSPLTNTYTDSHAGGHFSVELKKSGLDGIILTGKAKTKKYIWIKDDKIEFKDATHIWGNEVSNTVTNLRNETDTKARVACIGPAGENLSLISTIMLDKDSDKTRAGIAGRTGLGAVMGSKNIKAIVIKGSKKLEFEDEDLFKDGSKKTKSLIKGTEFMKTRFNYGSANLVGPMNKEGFLPTNNFKAGFIDNGEDLYCENMATHKSRNATCYGCPIACGQIIKTRSEEEVKIEYESIALLGSNNGLRNFMDVADACLACNELGLDTMSAGVIIGFAMECKEKNLLSDVPEFGDEKGQLQLLSKMAYREGIGNILTEGVKRASEKIGHGSEKFAIHVKGLELPGYEPRTSWGMALSYATSDRGACHQRCWTVNSERSGLLKMFSFDDKPEFVVDSQNERAAAYSVLVCDFMPFNVDDVCNAFSGVTGVDFTEEDYLKGGERIWNLIKLFNLREGFTRKDDTLPSRMFTEKLTLPKGVYDINEVLINKNEFEECITDYYTLRGWNEQGIPSLEKLKDLGLEEYAKF
ncbi:aldehyde ferredoxin oxidoreductase family protein [Clostridiaceae bacterium HSG29]|nr:aldehyde ferredoxin oxidoreductase family protein [Clostridiaceae bacterium HSG29]